MKSLTELSPPKQNILNLLKKSSAAIRHCEIVQKLSQHPEGTVSSAIAELKTLNLIEKEGGGWKISLDGYRLLQGEPQPTPPLVLHQAPPPPVVITAEDLEEALSLDCAREACADVERALAEIDKPLRYQESEFDSCFQPVPRAELEAELEALSLKPRLAGAHDAAWLLGALALHHWATPSISRELNRIADFIQREVA